MSPYMLPPDLTRESAKTFFESIKTQHKLPQDFPQLSYWIIAEIDNEYVLKNSAVAKKTPPKKPAADKEEVK